MPPAFRRGTSSHYCLVAPLELAASDGQCGRGTSLPGGRSVHRSDLRVDGPRVLLGVDDERRQQRIDRALRRRYPGTRLAGGFAARSAGAVGVLTIAQLPTAGSLRVVIAGGG